jgi:hypothetical protein
MRGRQRLAKAPAAEPSPVRSWLVRAEQKEAWFVYLANRTRHKSLQTLN